MRDDNYSRQVNNNRYTVTLLAVLLCSLGVVDRAHAEAAICKEGAYEVLYPTLGLFPSTAGDFAGPELRTTYIRHQSLRGLLAVVHCPLTAEKKFEEDRDLARRWIATLPEILDPYLRDVLKPEVLGNLVNAISCEPTTPLVCDLRTTISKLSRREPTYASRLRSASAVCGILGPTLMTEASADLAITDLADVITRDLAFLLSTCPVPFYAHMHAHPKDFESWLRWVNTQMFVGGEVDQKASLEAYRDALIASVQVSLHDRQYTSEKQRVLAHLQAKKVRIIN